MQHDRIPQGVVDILEKEQRHFLWGDQEGKKRWHALAWTTLCKPKINGGVGIKSLSLMNDAFLMKLLWRMRQKPGELWAQVLNGKYGRNEEGSLELVAKQDDSKLWKEMVRMDEKFRENVEITDIRGAARTRWKSNKTGEFSTASAYNWLM